MLYYLKRFLYHINERKDNVDMKKFIEEFKTFALRGNMMDMAVGVIIGGAFSAIVTSLTDNFINPILNFVTGGQVYTLQDVAGFASAFVLFCLLKGINKLVALGSRKKEEEAPATKKCPFCLSDIPVEATRCAHCTSLLETECTDNQIQNA